jgi:AAA domain
MTEPSEAEVADLTGRYVEAVRSAPRPLIPVFELARDSKISRLVCLADVRPERVDWLWPARIPLGKVTILDGDPGLGKSTIALDLLDEAKAVLRDLLDRGPMPSKDVQRQAHEAGISDATLRRAKDALGVKSIRPDGFNGPWSWTLPDGVHAQEAAYMLNPDREHVPAPVSMYTLGPELQSEAMRIFGDDPDDPGWSA